MQAKRENGLCYYYDETYSLGHKCKKLQVYMISGEEGSDEAEEGNTSVS